MRLLSMLCVLVLAMTGGCGRGASPPPTTTPPAQPAASPRIVSLSPAVSVILRDLGFQPSIVGRHAYELVLDPALPACGDQTGIDYEALLKLRPTHVFTQWGARDLPERLRTLAVQESWTLRDVNPLSLAGIAEATTTLDAALQATGTPRAKATLLAERMRALAKAPAATDARTVLLLASLAPPAALGPGSCHAEVLVGLGYTPAVREGSAYLELSREDVVRLDPWAIVLFAPRAPGSAAAEPQAPDAFASLRDLPLRAVREDRAAVLDDPLGLLPSTAMLGVADELRVLLSAWRERNP